jgi:hypothetical protein
VASRLGGFSTGRQVVRLRIPARILRRAKHAQLVVTAVGRNGGLTVAARRVRIR